MLPRTRGEDAAFRALVAKGQVAWRPLWEKTDDEGEVLDRYSTSDQPATTAEGYRLVWYHSLRKAEMDAVARSGRIEKALKQLAALREKLRSPRTRYRQEAKVAEAVAEILAVVRGRVRGSSTEVQPQTQETFHQDHRGRPGKDTHYVKKVATRFDLAYRIDDARVAADATSDGIFPLVSNVAELSELELLHAYKRQPAIEKRFSQLKTDFEVAPVYLKAVHRIQALLCRVLLRAVGRGPLGASVASGDAAERDRGIAHVPRGPCLPVADGTTGDRPVRVRATSHAGAWPAFCRGSGHRTDTSSTQAPEAAGVIGQGLRPLTWRRREIPRK